MTAAVALAAFVAGAWLLQQQSELPRVPVLLATSCVSCVILALRLATARALARLPDRRFAGSPQRLFTLAMTTLAALFLGFSHAAWRAQTRLADELAFADEGREMQLVGVVASLPAESDHGIRFEFDVEQIETADAHVPARVSLAWYSSLAQVRPGERWRFCVRLKRPHATSNPGGFDLEAWLLERNLRASGYVREACAGALPTAPQRLDATLWRPDYVIDRVRDFLRERLRVQLGQARYAGVLIALVLGDQRAIGEEDWTLFNRTGISHLVSISGLHITMIAGLMAAGVGAAWRRFPATLHVAPAQTAAAVTAVLAAWTYCMLAGWGIPAQRTFFMLATVALATLVRLGTRRILTLALAAAVVTLLDPWAVLAAGFWLSFGAVAAIFLAVGGRPRLAAGWAGRLREAARLQLAVTIALVPMTAALFQQVALVSPLANAVAIPIVSLLVTPLALFASLLVALPEPFPLAGGALLAVANALLAWLVELLRWSLQWPAASIALAAPPAWATVLAVVASAWLLAPPGWPARWAGTVWLLPLFAWPPQRPGPGEVWVTALDVGQGMAVVVETAEHVLVYDTGPRYSPQADAGSRILVPYLRSRGVDRIDLLVVSHLDSDHSGGARALFKAVDVARVWTSIDPDNVALERAREVQRCEAGLSHQLGATDVRLLHPTAADYESGKRSTNALSCVVELHFGNTRVLLTGDLPAEQELALLRRSADVRATLVTAPHHGSRLSSTEPFVRAVAPTWVVAQAGYRNRFGHPDPSVVERYRAGGARFVRTDESGAARWTFDGNGNGRLWTQRTNARRYWNDRPGEARTGPDGSANEPDEARPVRD